MKTTLIALFLATTAFAELPNPKHYRWVGCRPSPGECYNSCPDHRAYWQLDRNEQLCGFEGVRSKYACWCYTGPHRPSSASESASED